VRFVKFTPEGNACSTAGLPIPVADARVLRQSVPPVGLVTFVTPFERYPPATAPEFGTLWELEAQRCRLPLRDKGTMGTASGQPDSPHRMTPPARADSLRLATLAPAPLYAEQCQTLVVNPQGCGVKLSRRARGRNAGAARRAPGGLQSTARVANCLALGADGGFSWLDWRWRIQEMCWGIRQVPADWEEAMTVPTAPVAPAEDPSRKRTGPIPYLAEGRSPPGPPVGDFSPAIGDRSRFRPYDSHFYCPADAAAKRGRTGKARMSCWV